ncbi:MAG: N-acetylmuramoyl-L-alanine amidase [Methylobacter sp.]|nr:N-acetylmuramoyl-L-alanine amidase [Methylobacter sp.]
MKIDDHLLVADYVSQRQTPNKGNSFDPKYLIFHFTAGRGCKSSVDWLCSPQAKASAHLVVGRDGSITQLAPFNIVAWHAGKSCWNGLTGMNQYSVGIEMDNAGKLTKVGSKYRTWFQAEIAEDDVIQAKHKNESDMGFWHAYTDIQIQRANDLASLLVETYQLKDILGHEDIAPGRKNDPGPAFPLTNIHSGAFGRSDDTDDDYKVTVEGLNIRKGPGVEFDPVAPPLSLGTEILLLETKDRWSKVDVKGPNDIEGWVSNKFITSI